MKVVEIKSRYNLCLYTQFFFTRNRSQQFKEGKHVFCEKPPGRTLDDVKMMMAAEKENPSLKLMFGFNHRYHPGILEAKTIVDGGRFGKILFLRVSMGNQEEKTISNHGEP